MKRFLSLLLCMAILIGTFIPVYAAEAPKMPDIPEVHSLAEYEELVQSMAGTVTAQAEKSATSRFNRFLHNVRNVVRLLTGQALLPDKSVPVEIDEEIAELCNYIRDNSGLDICKILTSVPDCNELAQFTVKVFGIDTAEMRNVLFERAEGYWAEGKEVEGMLCRLIGSYFSIIKKCDIITKPTKNPDEFKVFLVVTFEDGDTLELSPGIVINRVTGHAYNKDKGLVNTGFNCDVYDLVVYAPVTAWMRQFGFCFFYDWTCYTTPDWMWKYTTRRFKFDYDGKEWMIQTWKGNYLITNGGEIGIYNRPKARFGTYYDCASDADMLEMSMRISHGDEEILSREPGMHWWINAFKMGFTLYEPKTLTMDATITMKDEEMLSAFCKAIDKNYRHDVFYETDGLTVKLHW